jgi:hypothetical protein
MDLDTILSELLAKFNADKAGVFAALMGKAHGLYQMAFDAGHRVAHAAQSEKITALETKVTDAERDKKAAEKKLDELQKQTPDVAKVTADFQQEIVTLKETHKNELAAEKAKRAESDHKRAMSDLKSKLERLVKPALAKILVQDEEIKKRVKVNADGTYEAMQDGKTIPFSPADGKDALDLLAAEIAEKQEADWRIVDGDEGSGVRTGSTTTGKASTVFDKVREKKAAEVKKQAEAPKRSLETALGMSVPT